MAGYKRRTSTKEIERRYLHIIELMVPLNGFGTRLNDMHSWHSTHDIQSQRGSGHYHKGRHYVRWCFAGPEDAKEFQTEFGGKLIRLLMR
jgi:hypothetical protein